MNHPELWLPLLIVVLVFGATYFLFFYKGEKEVERDMSDMFDLFK